MMMSFVFWTVYGLIGSIFFLFALLEGRRNRLGWTPLRVAGLLACAVWPLLVVAVVIVQKTTAPAPRQYRAPVPSERPVDRSERHYRRVDRPEPHRRLRHHGMR